MIIVVISFHAPILLVSIVTSIWHWSSAPFMNTLQNTVHVTTPDIVDNTDSNGWIN